jgi:hypothetical protein
LVSERRLNLVYVAPMVHLAICLIAMSGYVVPQLQFLEILWSILTIVDFPVSAVTVPLAYNNGFLAFLWTVIVGTAWWYFLSKGIVFLFKKLSK